MTRLIDKGFEAYLVGGCVRDLLLNRTPKDYDIATEARPPQVKRTFPRNCRIIGRRFKLAHLHFHRNTKILECSTFRRTPQDSENNGGDSDDLLIKRDNEFGTAEEDALRRDFTINALFLDPTEDKIVDHVNGLEDIEKRVIRTIGDPEVRFREDPVRILRAAKFAGRLGFTIEERTLKAMATTAGDLVRAAPPRVLEEILRLLRSGHARSSFELLDEIDALRYLVPVVGDFLTAAAPTERDEFWNLLGALDARIEGQHADDQPPPNGVLLAALMYPAVAAAVANDGTRSASSIAEDLLGSLATDLRLPRRDSGCLKRACGVQHRFDQAENKRRFRIDSFVQGPYFAESLELFELRTVAAGDDLERVDQWHDLAGSQRALPEREHDEHDQDTDADGEGADPDERASHDDDADRPRRKRRRRRRRQRDDDEAAAGASADDSGDDSAEASGDADDVAAQDSPAAESPTAESPAADPTPSEEPAPRQRRLRTKKARSEGPTAPEDLSDVVFPSSEEPAPHGDPMRPSSTAAAGGSSKSTGGGGRKLRAKAADKDAADVLFPLDEAAVEPAGTRDTFDLGDERDGAPHARRRDDDDSRNDRHRRDAESNDERDHDHDHDQGDAAVDAEGDATEREPADGEHAQDEAGERRRRRRRRRRSRRDTEDEAEPARSDRREDDATIDADEGDDREVDDREGPDLEGPDLEGPDREGPDRDDEAGDEAASETGEDGERRRRRRRRRGRQPDEEARDSQTDDRDSDARDAEDRDSDDRDSEDRDSGDRAVADRAGDDADAKERRSRRGRRGRRSQKDGRGRDEGNRREDKRRDDDRRDGDRRGKKKGKQKPGSRKGGARDVDVVPRYRDRRGKVEVIEPVDLDLSAFDVELDPKRVPTFGSIVEGKGRPKRRNQRLADKSHDDYRPPPPPGGEGPGAPPPPAPKSDDDDTFGDW